MMSCPMENSTIFATYIAPIASILISLSVVAIAYRQSRTANRQSRTANDKLRFDLYERRLAVYDAAANYLEMGIKLGQDPSINEAQVRSAYIRAWREARFLFGKDSKVYGILKEMQNHVVTATAPIDAAEVLYSPEVHKEHLQRREESIHWITTTFDQLSDAIEPFLDFRTLQNTIVGN